MHTAAAAARWLLRLLRSVSAARAEVDEGQSRRLGSALSNMVEAVDGAKDVDCFGAAEELFFYGLDDVCTAVVLRGDAGKVEEAAVVGRHCRQGRLYVSSKLFCR
jgi:hypothetical protein